MACSESENRLSHSCVRSGGSGRDFFGGSPSTCASTAEKTYCAPSRNGGTSWPSGGSACPIVSSGIARNRWHEIFGAIRRGAGYGPEMARPSWLYYARGACATRRAAGYRLKQPALPAAMRPKSNKPTSVSVCGRRRVWHIVPVWSKGSQFRRQRRTHFHPSPAANRTKFPRFTLTPAANPVTISRNLTRLFAEAVVPPAFSGS